MYLLQLVLCFLRQKVRLSNTVIITGLFVTIKLNYPDFLGHNYLLPTIPSF